MGTYKIIKDVKNLPRELKISLQNLVDECELAHNKTLESHIDPFEDKKALVLLNGQDVEGVVFFEEQNKILYIDILYVSYASRKKGYGKKLLQVLNKVGKENGFEKIELVVRRDNKTALNLYQKLNFIKYKSVDESVVSMTKYVDNNVYILGGILFELLKENNGVVNPEKIEFSPKFTKYVKSENAEEIIEKKLKSKTLSLAIKILKAKENGKISEESLRHITRYAKSEQDIFGDKVYIDNVEFLKDSDKKTLAKAFSVLDVVKNLKLQNDLELEEKNFLKDK